MLSNIFIPIKLLVKVWELSMLVEKYLEKLYLMPWQLYYTCNKIYLSSLLILLNNLQRYLCLFTYWLMTEKNKKAGTKTTTWAKAGLSFHNNWM